MARVQIENAPAMEVIERYDTPETLFYLDPPYVHDTRGDKHAYHGEMSDFEHTELANLLHGIQGRAALSGYRGELSTPIDLVNRLSVLFAGTSTRVAVVPQLL